MTRLTYTTQPWRALWLIPVAILATLSIIATGGGGGDEDGFVDDGSDLPPTILPNYNFFLANAPGDNILTASVGNLLTVAASIDGVFPANLDLNSDANNNVTFLSYSIRRSARVNLTVSGAQPSQLDGTAAVIVTEEINAMLDEAPGNGVFDVITNLETVTVSILNNGVQLVLNGGEPVVYNSWDEFSNLFEDEMQETWQRRASLGASAMDFMVSLFFDVADVLDELEAVTLNNPTVEVCDMFPSSPPAGVLPQGEVTITWLGSGELSDGDDFTWQFNQCWNADSGELLDGTITLENYTESIDSNNNTLFEIGFGSLGGNPGGVFYEFTISDTEENLGLFTISPDDVITVSGGFAAIIQTP